MFGPDFTMKWWLICHNRDQVNAILNRFMEFFGINTHVALADNLKIHQSEVSNWKRSNAFPLEIFEKVIWLRGLNPEWLISGEGDQLLDDMPDQQADYMRFSIFVRAQLKYLLANYQFTCLPHGYVNTFAANLFDLQDHSVEVLVAEMLRRLYMAGSVTGLPMNELRKLPLDVEYSRADIITRASAASGMDRPALAKAVARYIRKEHVDAEEADEILQQVEAGELEFPLELLFYLFAVLGVNIIYVLTGLGEHRIPLLLGNADDAWRESSLEEHP